jgi:hypothetical protein
MSNLTPRTRLNAPRDPAPPEGPARNPRLFPTLAWVLAGLLALAVPGAPVRASHADDLQASLAANDLLAAHRAAHAWAESEPALPRARLALASTYARFDAAVAVIEQVRAGLRHSPDPETARALHHLAALAYERLDEPEAAWCARLAANPTPWTLGSDELPRVIDAYAAMLSRPAVAALLERLTREAATGGPETTLRLVSLTYASGDLGTALAIAQRGRERFPTDLPLLNEWLRLLAIDPSGGEESPSEERLHLLRATFAQADQLGADRMHVETLRRVLDRRHWDWRPARPTPPAARASLPVVTRAVASFETTVRAESAKHRQAERALARLVADTQARVDADPTGKGTAATWQGLLDAVLAGLAQQQSRIQLLDELADRGQRLQEAANALRSTGPDAEAPAAGALADRVDAIWGEPLPVGEPATTEAPLNPEVEAQRLIDVVVSLRERLAQATLREALVAAGQDAARILAATDTGLAAGAMTVDAWQARARAAATLKLPLEAGFAAARAFQEARAGGASGQSQLLTEASARLRDNREAATKAATQAGLHLTRGELTQALAGAEEALRHDPLHAAALKVHFDASLATGDEPGALADLRQLWRAGLDDVIEWPTALNAACRAADWALLFSLAEAATKSPGAPVDAWYFYGLAARALGLDHLAPEIAAALKPSVWHQQNRLGDFMVKLDREPPAKFFLDYDFNKILGTAAEPAGLRLWAAWREGLRGVHGKADPELRKRLVAGAAEAPAIIRLLGQSGAAELAASAWAKASPALATWVEAALAWGSGDAATSVPLFARIAADPSLPVELRALSARFASTQAAPWRPWRKTDILHLNARLLATGLSSTIAAPGQLVLLSTPLPSGYFGGSRAERIRGIGSDARLLVGSTLGLIARTTPDGQGEASGNKDGGPTRTVPALWEWEELAVEKSPSAPAAQVSVGRGVQLSLRRVECRAGVNWEVAGVLDVQQGTGSTSTATVAKGGLWLARDAAWFVHHGSIAGRADWRRGHLDLYGGTLTIKQGGALSLADLSLRWETFPVLEPGATLTWQTVLGRGSLKREHVTAGWRTQDSLLAGEWPDGVAAPAGLKIYAVKERSSGEPRKVANLQELEAALKQARPGEHLQLAPGTYRVISTVNLPLGVTLDATKATFQATTFGSAPLMTVRGAGFVRVRNLTIKRDDPGVHPASWTKRPLLEVADGAIVELDGGSWDWNTFTETVPSLDLKGRSRVLARTYTYLRGSARLAEGSELKLFGASPDDFHVRGNGRLLLTALGSEGAGLKASGAGLRVDGTVGKATLLQGAGSERDLERQRLLVRARDTVWQKAAQTLQQAMATAPDLSKRIGAAQTFTRAVAAANSEAQRPDEEASEFAWKHMKPIYQARPTEAPYHDLYTYPIYGPRLRPDADVGPAVVAARNAHHAAGKMSQSHAGTPSFERALALTRAYPPGSVEYAAVESAFQRGLSPADLQRELVQRAQREAAERKAAEERRKAAAKAAEAARRAAAVAQQQKPMFTPYSAGARSYGTNYGGGGSSSSGASRGWQISDSARAQLYSRELDVRIRQSTFGR